MVQSYKKYIKVNLNHIQIKSHQIHGRPIDLQDPPVPGFTQESDLALAGDGAEPRSQCRSESENVSCGASWESDL